MMAGDIQQSRLASLDAARGFDMFFIMGGEGLVVSIAALLGFPEFHASFGHVPWDGLNFMDTVFPTFLFLAGVTFPFSAAKSRERGATDLQIGLKALRRCALLILLGLIHDGPLLRFDFAHLRVWSVLGRIGIAWFGAALLYLAFRTKARVGIAAGLLAFVVIATRFLLAPDAPDAASPFSAEGNIGCWLDRTLTGGHTYQPHFDPEGFAGILPAVVTAMLGMFVGEIVRRDVACARRDGGDKACRRARVVQDAVCKPRREADDDIHVDERARQKVREELNVPPFAAVTGGEEI